MEHDRGHCQEVPQWQPALWEDELIVTEAPRIKIERRFLLITRSFFLSCFLPFVPGWLISEKNTRSRLGSNP